MKSALLIAFCFFYNQAVFSQKKLDTKIQVNGVWREYIVHIPTGYTGTRKLPLMLIFHGGGGNYKQMQPYFKMDPIADRDSFFTVYPNALNKNWNDGREFDEKITQKDDVSFINHLLDTLLRQYAIDEKRIFATGISNGGFFSYFLSLKLNGRLLGVAPFCATIPERIKDSFAFTKPVNILMINGTRDPLVPYNGGEVGNKITRSRGRCISTDSTLQRYLAINGITTSPVITELPDKNKRDGSQPTEYAYMNEKTEKKTVLIKIDGGGHTIPGSSQYLPKFMVGTVCNDFEGNERVWAFFKDCK